ncbi:flavin reductase family protein [Reichenbachiella ulvae]|uniref:Flavin reductase family protein n=1 Tax=Reichenbachiella ulvae TaxID=2980104 RepID=A0ABT3CTC9_9BACT|nr:flavin reductase family protein [Reichenbachiella ulvae]MCV9386961.1 flavin reductase family protein [Reichenbachiella ulvae]
MEYKSFDPKELSQPELHGYMLSAVAPRPICFASTIDKAGNVNLSPFSFFNVFSSNPPIMIFSPSRRGRDNTTKHSFENVTEVPEVVINIVNHPIVEQMSLSSTEYDKGVNEFVKTGLTPIKSEMVKPPRVGESPVSFECKVIEVKPLGDGPGAGNLVVSEVLRVHIRPEYLGADGKLDSHKLDLVARMGGSWYCRATRDAMFEIPKPLQKKGIGVDALPESARNSTVLTGNNLGRLGNVESLPSEQEVNELSYLNEIKVIVGSELDRDHLIELLHQKAQQWLNEGEVKKALSLVLFAEQWV